MDQENFDLLKVTSEIVAKSEGFLKSLNDNFNDKITSGKQLIDSDILSTMNRIESSLKSKKSPKKKYYKKEPEIPEDWDFIDERMGSVIVKTSNRFYWENRPKIKGKIFPTSYDTLPPEYALPHGLNLLNGNIVRDTKSPW